jgi:hypothetical protein
MPIAAGNIAIKTFGFKRSAEVLGRMGLAASDAIPFWEMEIIPDLERIEFQVFKSQGRRGGGSWKFLSQETIQTKVRKGESPLINVATGMLLESLSVNKGFEGELVSPYAIREVAPTFLTFGSSAPGAVQSQEHRPFLRVTRFDVARWSRWWARYIIRIAKLTGAKLED